jgi:type II secretory pathway pseudopilin PulG
MVLSKRERILALATLLVLGTLMVNSLILDPLFSRRQQAANERIDLEAQLADAQNTFDRRKLLERRWKTVLEGMRSDTDAESRVTKALNEWSRQTRLTLTSIKPERTTADKGMREITFVVAGRGSLEAVASFLHKVETAELPVKLTTMTVGSTSESGDNMSLQLRLSTVYFGSSPSSEQPTQPKPPEANYEESLL